ncbi:hypothetical protein PHJA_002273900 [Phtheirospermum japonicum]|uniref:Uncharacterized protein n=1 Tax=Phtheirospermum japonicum TaxID=374723 RepID=A0A830CQP4_9LAMI|nr:hypothetical protein PHJA_002273900 [Phtheirospermum japonicum]
MEGSPPALNQKPPEAMVKCFKPLWRAFLIFNFGLGSYIFYQASKKPRGKQKNAVPAEVPSAPAAVTAPIESEPVISPPTTRPVIVRQPVPEDQQREIFKWMLEEKRKVKPQSREDKKRIDEEKAILKEFIRSESIPRI